MPGVRPLASLSSFTLVLVLAACGGQQPSATPTTADQPVAVDAPNGPVALNTFDGRYIQIDACPNTIPPFPDLAPFSGLTNPGCGGNWSGDANLFVGNDHDMLLSVGKTAVTQPGPASMSANFPAALTNASPTFIDWDDLTSGNDLTNHYRSDFGPGMDPTAFPGSNSCVGAANVLDKMNLTYVSVSNNTDYAYFGVQRRDNSGDAGYMWIFNKLAPPSFGNETSLLGTNDGLGDNCASTAYPLTFKVSKGDVLFKGHFAPSSTIPLLRIFSVGVDITASTTVQEGNTTFTATCDSPSGPCYVILPAKTAINWTTTINGTASTLWTEKADYVAGAAANTSLAGLGSTGGSAAGFIGSAGLKTPIANGGTYSASDGTTWKCTDPNGCMEDNLFAEVAVPITAFTGGSVCGATFYGSVISRSSGTTPSPDMKDLAGPYRFNFGSARVTAVVTPTCGSGTSAAFDYKIGSYTGLAGSAIDLSACGAQGCACAWYLDGSTTAFSTTCNYADVLKTVSTANPHSLRLTATDGSCPASATVDNINVYPPPAVNPSMASACTNFGTAASPLIGFDYASNGSGVAGTGTYAWSFTGGFTGSSSSASGSIDNISVSSSYTGTAINGALTLYDKRSGVSGVACLSPDTATDCCVASGNASTTPYLPVRVSLAVTPTSLACGTVAADSSSNFDTGVTFTATAKGGNGTYSYSWGGSGCSGTSTSSTTCAVNDTNTCSDKSASVQVSSSVCTAASNTPTGKYDKLTTVSASVTNP